MSDRMPDSRRSSRGRHRAQAAPAGPGLPTRLRLSNPLRPGKTAQGVLVLGLVLTLGGYTAAESATQRDTAAAAQEAVATAAADRAVVAGERADAVEVARTTITDANAVHTATAASVSPTDLAVLTDAVDHLTALIEDVDPNPADPADPASAGSGERASRGVTRDALPPAEPSSAASAAPDDAVIPDATAPDTAAAAADATADADAAADATATGTVDADQAASAAAVAVAGSDAAQVPLAAPTPTGTAATGSGDAFRASSVVIAPDDYLAAGIVAASVRVANLSARLQTSADQIAAAAVEAAAAAAEAERVAAAAAELAAKRASLSSYANGRVPASALCEIGFATGQQLRCDAAEALTLLNASYKATFGNDLVVTDSYRSYAAQVACSRTKGRLCATPGTSNHGRGVALDLGDGVQVYTSAEHRWMAAHAGAFGWELPDWASITGSKHEPWHWEFTG